MAAVGKRLKEAREARGLSIDDIQQLTKIQKRYLESLEQDDFSMMPGTFYVRGFIRQYAEAVALDSQQILDIFDGKTETSGVASTSQAGGRVEQVSGSRLRNHGGSSNQNKAGISWPVVILTVIVVVLAGGILYMTVKDWNGKKPVIDPQESVEINRESQTTTSQPETQATTTTETEPPAPAAPAQTLELVSADTAVTTMTLTNATNPVKIQFTGVNGPCWVGVLVAGEYVYQNSLVAGTVGEIELTQGVTDAVIILGASANVTVKVNDLDMNFNPENTQNVKRNVNLAIVYADAAEPAVTP